MTLLLCCSHVAVDVKYKFSRVHCARTKYKPEKNEATLYNNKTKKLKQENNCGEDF